MEIDADPGEGKKAAGAVVSQCWPNGRSSRIRLPRMSADPQTAQMAALLSQQAWDEALGLMDRCPQARPDGFRRPQGLVRYVQRARCGVRAGAATARLDRASTKRIEKMPKPAGAEAPAMPDGLL